MTKVSPNLAANSRAISAAPQADFPLSASQERQESSVSASAVPVREQPMFGRQRQPKGQPLERLEARVKPETAAWLRKLAGDSSIGIALDYLRSILPLP